MHVFVLVLETQLELQCGREGPIHPHLLTAACHTSCASIMTQPARKHGDDTIFNVGWPYVQVAPCPKRYIHDWRWVVAS
jgi:hypothetical protein